MAIVTTRARSPTSCSIACQMTVSGATTADATSPSGSAWSVSWSLPRRGACCPVWRTVPPTHAPSSPSDSSKVASPLQVASRTASAVRHTTVSSCRLRREVPTRALPEVSFLIQRHVHDHTMSRRDELPILRIATAHIHRNMHAGSPRIDQLSMHLHNIPNMYGFIEANAADIHSGTWIPTPPCGTDIPRFIHPFHYRPTVDLPIDVYVGRCGEESQGDFSNPFRRYCHGYVLCLCPRSTLWQERRAAISEGVQR